MNGGLRPADGYEPESECFVAVGRVFIKLARKDGRPVPKDVDGDTLMDDQVYALTTDGRYFIIVDSSEKEIA